MLLLGASPFAFGQDPLSGELDGTLSPTFIAPTYLSVRLPRFDGGEAWVLGRRRAGVVTRERGETSERYVANTLGAGFSAPLRFGRRRAVLQAQTFQTWLDARFSDGDAPSRFGTGEIALAGELTPNVTLAVSGRDRDARADYAGPLAREGLTTIGIDPDLDVRLRERAVGLAATARFGRDAVGLGLGRASVAASLAAIGDLDRLRLPLSVEGTDIALSYDRALSATRTLGLRLTSRALSGDGEVTLGQSRAIGRGGSHLRTTVLSLARTDRYANGGLLRYGVETARSRFSTGGRVEDAREIRPDVPVGTSARYRANVEASRTELAALWELPQRRGRLTLGYRHAIVAAEASAGYTASAFLLSFGDQVSERLDRTAAGIFDVGYARRIGRYDLGLDVQQVVPYRFGSGGSGIGGGTGGGGSSRTEGGWTLAVRVGRRF